MLKTNRIFSALIFSIVFFFMGLSLAGADGAKEPSNFTRILIFVSGPVKYSHAMRSNPPRVVINFTSKNIFANIEEEVLINKGIIKKANAEYYPKNKKKESAPALKSLTFYLAKKAPYKIIKEKEMLIVQIKAPKEFLTQEFSYGDLAKKVESAFIGSLIEAEKKLKKREIKAPADLLPIASPEEKEAKKTIEGIESFLKNTKPETPQIPLQNKPEDAQKDEEGVIESAWMYAAAHPVSLGMIIMLLVFGAGFFIMKLNDRGFMVAGEITPKQQEEIVRSLIIQFDPRSSISEAYRILRTNILSVDKEKPIRTLLITSALPGEGKTTVASNLAVTLANAGSKVLLVDSALRNPLIHRIFELNAAPGLAEILGGGLLWTEAINSTEIKNLSIITSGKLPFNPSEILTSAKMKEIIENFKSRFDIILFDSPDVIGVTDSAVLGSIVDGILLVVHNKKTQRETVMHAQSLLESARGRVIGCILSKVNSSIPKWLGRYLNTGEPKL